MSELGIELGSILKNDLIIRFPWKTITMRGMVAVNNKTFNSRPGETRPELAMCPPLLFWINYNMQDDEYSIVPTRNYNS